MAWSMWSDQGTSEDVHDAMALALRIGAVLLAGGESAEQVGQAMSAVGAAYGLPSCEVDVTMGKVSLSYLTSDGPPVTADRMVHGHGADFSHLREIHRLVQAIRRGELSPREADARLSSILTAEPPYPAWILSASLPALSAAAAVLVGGRTAAAAGAFAAAVLGHLGAAWLAGRGVKPFFQVVFAAAAGGLVAELISEIHSSIGSETVIIGVVMGLLPGRAMVVSLWSAGTGGTPRHSSRSRTSGTTVIRRPAIAPNSRPTFPATPWCCAPSTS